MQVGCQTILEAQFEATLTGMIFSLLELDEEITDCLVRVLAVYDLIEEKR